MERSRFIETAPNYYALAVAHYFRLKAESASEDMVRRYYALPGQLDFPGDEPVSHLKNEILFQRAAQILVQRGFLTETTDDFAPTIYQKTEEFEDAWERAEQDAAFPFKKYGLVNNSREMAGCCTEQHQL
jgi:hypothetical protein